MTVAWNKKTLRGLFEKSVRKIRKRGKGKTFEEYQEFEKKADAMTPSYDETIKTEITRKTQVITSEKDLPVKLLKAEEKPPVNLVKTNKNELLKIPAVSPIANISLQKSEDKEKAKPEIKGAIKKEEAKEASVYSQAPVILNFPNISDALKKKGVISINEPKAKVRGIPSIAHKLPKKEAGKKISSDWEPPNLEKVDVRYPLIEPYAYAVIKWNKELNSLNYTVIEPPLTKAEKENLERLKDLIIDLLDINLMDVKNIKEVQKYLKEKLNQMISDYEIRLTETEYNKILYYIYRNFLGLDKIEPLMQDPGIEDISCDGGGIPIFIFHRKYGSLRTNIVFNDNDNLNKFISKLAQRSGKHISVAEPLLDGALPDGSRLQATYSTGGDIAMRGSTFTIRKFTKDPLTIIDFMNFGTIPSMIAAYLWLAIEYRNSVLISGGTATGKTSALNALSLFLAPESKIVSIEDTPELRLPHEHWIAKVSRMGYGPEGVTGKRKGEISMFDLLKAALRERPDELIVGEVRGAEAYVLFQGMATGHAGLATIHAESIEAVINRLTSRPINLSAGLLQHLDIVMIMGFSRINGIDIRRVKEIIEIIGVDEKSGKPVTNTLFRWIPAGDYFEFASDRSYVLNKIIEEKGIPEKSVWEELQRRMTVLDWLKKENIRYFEDVGRIISNYYRNPEGVVKKIQAAK